MPQITFLPHQEICPRGAVIETEVGTTICDAALQNGIEIEHSCEKSCACTTCHVIVRQGFDTLPEASEEEDDLLDKAWGLEPESRLSCQTPVHEEDLVVEIPRYTINLHRIIRPDDPVQMVSEKRYEPDGSDDPVHPERT